MPYRGQECLDCPPEYSEDPEAHLLCTMWSGLNALQALSPLPILPVSSTTPCMFLDNPTSSTKLCSLWCQIKLYSGIECQTPCPAGYLGDPAEELLCMLWAELMELEEETVSTVDPNDSGVTTTSPGSPLAPVECKYSNHTTSSDPLCTLWCAIQEHQGLTC